MKSLERTARSVWMAFMACLWIEIAGVLAYSSSLSHPLENLKESFDDKPIALSLDVTQFHKISDFAAQVPLSSEGIDEMAVLSLGKTDESFFGAFQEWMFGAFVEEDNLLKKFLAQVLFIPNQSETKVSLRRFLSDDKWAAFNLLFKDTVLHIPNVTLTKKILFDLVLGVVNPTCKNISIEDIVFGLNQTSPRQLNIDVSVKGLDITCNSGYNYAYGLIKGSGSVDMYTDNNSADTMVTFTTSASSFNESPPDLVNTQVVNVNFQITKLDFHGGFVAGILDIFEQLFKNFIEKQLENTARNELGTLGTKFLENLVNVTQKKIAPLLVPLPFNISNPLQIEQDFLASSSSESGFLNFRDYGDNAVAKLVAPLLAQLVQMFAQPVPDPSSPTGSGQDLGINKFLRQTLLDNSRGLTVLVAQLPFQTFNPVLFSSDDVISNAKVVLEGFTILGLDTFRNFDPLVAIGNYTLLNSFRLETLRLKVRLTVEMKQSDLPNAILTGSSQKVAIRENVTVTFGIDDLKFALSMFMLFKEKPLLNIELGSILKPENIVSCLASITHDLKISGLPVSVTNMIEPEISGFVSPGIDYLVTTAINAVFRMFEPTLLKAVNRLFQTSIRTFLQEQLVSALKIISSNNSCDWQPSGPPMIDFRDLFLGANESRQLGGTGTAPYGTLVSLAYKLLQNQVFDVVGFVTKMQSKSEGELFLPELIPRVETNTFESIGIPSTEFEIGNMTARNLNTLTAPVTILQPNKTDPSLLDNHIRLGSLPTPLSIMLTTMLQLSGDSLLSSHNELDIGISLVAPEINASILARVNASQFMGFPLRNLGNYNCWLALFEPPIQQDALRLLDRHSGLSLQQFSIGLEAMHIYASCHLGGSCTTSSIPFLAKVLTTYEDRGIAGLLQNRVLQVAEELASGPFLQTFLDRLIVDSSKRCSEPDKYSQSAPLVPSLTPGSLDLLVFGGAYFFEALLLVVFKAHESYLGVEIGSPQAQVKTLSEDAELIDFRNLSASLGNWAENAVDSLRSYAQGWVDDGQGGQEIGLNLILRGFLLNDARLWTFDLSENSMISPILNISLGDIIISGLDSASAVSLLQPIGPQTFINELILDHVSCGLEVKVQSGNTEVNTLIQLEIEQLHLKVAISAAIDKGVLGNLEFGQILHSDRIFGCLLSSARTISFPVLDLSFGDIASFNISGFNDSTTGMEMEQLTGVTLSEFKGIILENMGQFFNHSIKAILNNFVTFTLSQESTTACPKSSRLLESSTISSVDFRDLLLAPNESVKLGGSGTGQYGDIIRLAVDLLDEKLLKVDPTTGLSLINSILITKFTEAQSNVSGRLSFNRDLVTFGNRIQIGGMDVQISFRAYNGYINNLDTVGAPLSLLDPVFHEKSNLNNTASVGVERQLELGARLFLSIIGSGEEIVDDLDIRLSVERILVILEALLRLSEQRFYTYPLRDLLSFDCLLSIVPAPDLDAKGVRVQNEDRSAGLLNLAVSVALLKLNVTCAGTCSPGISKLADLLSTPTATNSSTQVANHVLSYVTKLLGGTSLQVPIDRMIYQAHRNCPSSPLYLPNAAPLLFDSFQVSKPPESTFLAMLFISASCAIVALVAVMLAVKIFVRYRHRRWLRLLPQRDLDYVLQEQTQAQRKAEIMNEISTSMFRSPEIPVSVRLAMPLIILGNLAFFMSGHLSLGGTVNIVVSLGGSTLRVNNFFEFSIMSSTMEIWNAGGRALALMIIIFSIIWPYTKQLITLALWFLPPNRMSISTRGSYLAWLDILAKWSIADVMTLIVTVAAFRVSIQSPNVAFLPPGFYSLDLIVVPLWGLYANMIAQLISQISSHFILYYHRKIETRARQQFDQSHETKVLESTEFSSPEAEEPSNYIASEPLDDERNDKLCSHYFIRPHRSETDTLRVRRAINPAVIIVFVILSVMVIVGCVLPSFSVQVFGFVGVLVQSGQDFAEAKTEHSLFTIINLMREQADFTGRVADHIGLGSLSALLFISVLVVPIAQAAVLVYMWYFQMTTRRRKLFMVVIETLQAWQYSEVYILSILIAAWQIGPVSDFMINSYCDSLGNMFALLVYYGILKEEDAQCFRVEAYVDDGSYILAAGAILLALVNTFVMKAVIQYFRDLDHKSMDENTVEGLDEQDEKEDAAAREFVARQIHPVPVLFSDTFRWCLVSENSLAVGVVSEDHQDQENNFLSEDHQNQEESFCDEAMPEEQSVALCQSEISSRLPTSETSTEYPVFVADDEWSCGKWSYSADSNTGRSNRHFASNKNQRDTEPDEDESVTPFLDENPHSNISTSGHVGSSSFALRPTKNPDMDGDFNGLNAPFV